MGNSNSGSSFSSSPLTSSHLICRISDLLKEENTKGLDRLVDDLEHALKNQEAKSGSTTNPTSTAATNEAPLNVAFSQDDITLLQCLLALPPRSLTRFSSSLALRTWFLSSLRECPTRLLQSTDGSDVSGTYPYAFKLYNKPLTLLLENHLPERRGDFVWLVYDTVFEKIFGTKSGNSSLSSSSSPPITFSSLSASKQNSAIKLFLHFHSSYGIQAVYSFLCSQVRIENQPKVIQQVMIVNDLLHEYGIVWDAYTEADVFTELFANADVKLMKDWLATTRNSSDSLWPIRSPKLIDDTISIQAESKEIRRIGETLEKERKRWQKEVVPLFVKELNRHLINDISRICMEYLIDIERVHIAVAQYTPSNHGYGD